MYVEIEPTKIEGMVALRDIRSDFFEFDDEHYTLVGRRTHKVYNLGDAVRIRVKKANQDQCLLDYELVEPDAPERPSGGQEDSRPREGRGGSRRGKPRSGEGRKDTRKEGARSGHSGNRRGKRSEHAQKHREGKSSNGGKKL